MSLLSCPHISVHSECVFSHLRDTLILYHSHWVPFTVDESAFLVVRFLSLRKPSGSNRVRSKLLVVPLNVPPFLFLNGWSSLQIPPLVLGKEGWPPLPGKDELPYPIATSWNSSTKYLPHNPFKWKILISTGLADPDCLPRYHGLKFGSLSWKLCHVCLSIIQNLPLETWVGGCEHRGNLVLLPVSCWEGVWPDEVSQWV